MDIPELVIKLAQEQKKRRWTDAEFAQALNVSRSTWGKTKHGKLSLGWAISIAAVTLFPELVWNVLEAMRDDFHESIKDGAA